MALSSEAVSSVPSRYSALCLLLVRGRGVPGRIGVGTPRAARLPHETMLQVALLCCSVQSALSVDSPAASSLVLSTDALKIELSSQGGGVVGVWDRLGERNLVLNATSPHPLVQVVYVNETQPTAPSELTLNSDGAGGGVLVATFDGGASVSAVANVVDERIEIVVSKVSAGTKAIFDLHMFNVPVVMESVAAGPVAVLDTAFAMAMLPVEPRWKTNVAVAEPSRLAYTPGYTPYFSGCNGSSGAILQARAWNLSAVADGGLVGRGAGLWAGKRENLDAAIQSAQAKYNLPSPDIDGVWHKRNAKSGYFLITVTPETLDDAISYASQSGIEYITFLDNIWAGAGHYNVSTLWGGHAGLSAAVKRIKAAGLKAGIHTMSGNIVKSDAYVTPVPDPRLAKTPGGSRTLAAAIGPNDSWIPLVESPFGLPVAYGVQQPRLGAEMQIGDEIVRYSSINTTAPFGLNGVTRGMYNTNPAAHQSGATIAHLAQMYNGYLPDPATTLLAEVGANLAWAYKSLGMSMIYFDGLEAHSLTGPAITGAPLSRAPGVAEAGLHQAFWEALDGHDALTESSSSGGPLWHLNTRTGQTDWAGTDRRAYLDFSKGPDMLAAACKSLDTPDMGWWGYNTFAAGSYHATTPDEVEYMASRVRAWNASPNFETSTSALSTNGRTAEAFARMRPWLTLNLPEETKLQLRAVDVDYILHRDEAKNQSWIVPSKKHEAHIADPSDPSTCKWSLNVSYPPLVKQRVGVRLRAIPAVAAADTGNTVDLLSLSDPEVKRSKACLPGGTDSGLISTAGVTPPSGGPTTALQLNYTESSNPSGSYATVGCSLNLYTTPVNLTTNRVLEITVHGDGSGALLAVQLQDVGNGFRDWFVTLSFNGWRTVRLGLPAGRTLYTHAGGKLPSPADNKMAMRDFNWAHTLALNFYVTDASSAMIYIGSLSALSETPATVGVGSTLTIGGVVALTVPVQLHGVPCAVGGRGPEGGGGHAGENNCEDYVECADVSNASSCRVFDANNNELNLTRRAGPGAPTATENVGQQLPATAVLGNAIEYSAATGSLARVEVTVFEHSDDKLGPF